jgi:hypothetical protein
MCVTVPATAAITAAPASAGLSERTCKNFWTGDHKRRLSVCARIWFSPTPAQQRGVVEMHTYVLVNGYWVDETSKTLSLNSAQFDVSTYAGNEVEWVDWGTDWPNRDGTVSCRVNNGTQTACSVPNTGRVAYYSKLVIGVGQRWKTCVYRVSWRDPLGAAHEVKAGDNSYPDKLPFCYQESVPA